MTDSDGQRDAHVQVLTAEVRTLMVGSRQVTLSVAKQVDLIAPCLIEPFGRICTIAKPKRYDLEVIGRDRHDGSLCRSKILVRPRKCGGHRNATVGYSWMEVTGLDCPHSREPGHEGHYWSQYLFDEYMEKNDPDDSWKPYHSDWEALPLIVLAGLR